MAAARGSTRKGSRRDVGERSGWRFKDEDVERLLRSGEHSALLTEYFGPREYQALRDLAREAASARSRGGPRVLILPGIMGSKLGLRRDGLDDVLWIDPIEIAAGRLTRLALHGPSPYEALGVLLLAYLKLKLRLQVAGFDASFHAFDWRQDIEALGRQLVRQVQRDPARRLHVVAHSMGGLVTRAALTVQPDLKIDRFVMLGTPNFGSFVPVLALRGEYPIVQKLAALDVKHSAEELSAEVFTTLPGLIQMLPSPERFQKVDLYDERTWPDDDRRPGPAMLRRAREVHDLLADADDRFFLIAGVNQRTVTGLIVEDGQFKYEETSEGDGTVPLAFAQLAGAHTWYVDEAHGSLPNNGTVGDAVVDLLERGTTDRLPRQWSAPSGRERRIVDPRQARVEPFEGRRGRELTTADHRELLAEVAAPSARQAAGAPVPEAKTADDAAAAAALAGYAHHFDRVIVGRRRQRMLEIRLALGSLTEVRARAYVLGVFQGVDPAGAAVALDARLGGAIHEFTTRRMISGYVGEAFIMPTGRHLVYADTVLLIGLGGVDGFTSEVQQFVAETAARTLTRTFVDDFATVLFGAGSGQSVARSLYNLLFGFFRGLREADDDQMLRRITLCELDRAKFLEMKEELYRLASTDLFGDFQVTFDDVELPPPAPPPVTRRAAITDGSAVMYLIVGQEAMKAGRTSAGGAAETVALRSTILTPTGKAAILSGLKQFKRSELDALLAQIDGIEFTFEGLGRFGGDLTRLVLDPDVAAILGRHRDAHLVVVHDAAAARIPWETLCVDGWFPAAQGGLSRRYAADDLSIAKWADERRTEEGLRVLLVVNPTEDLAGAKAEAQKIREAFPASSAIQLDTLEGRQATRRALLTAFRSGRYDVIHYAGHAEFNAAQPSLSGIVCHGDEMLTGADLAGLSKLPFLVFFNACESGRIRGRKPKLPVVSVQRASRGGSASERVRALIDKNVGLAEAFMRGGVANYVGTYWPVADQSASSFAEVFYSGLAGGETIGKALRSGRQKVLGLKSADWADYIHYGSDGFSLKRR